jgi:hypothetical protein
MLGTIIFGIAVAVLIFWLIWISNQIDEINDNEDKSE